MIVVGLDILPKTVRNDQVNRSLLVELREALLVYRMQQLLRNRISED